MPRSTRRFDQSARFFARRSHRNLRLHLYFVKLFESEKNCKSNDFLDVLEFNQVVIFVSNVARANELNRLLTERNFPFISIHAGMTQEERIAKYNSFKEFNACILVSTDLFSRGTIDVECVNVIINYDFPGDSDRYLRRVGRVSRFGTKGIAISFVSSDVDEEIIDKVQSHFEVIVIGSLWDYYLSLWSNRSDDLYSADDTARKALQLSKPNARITYAYSVQTKSMYISACTQPTTYIL